MSKITDNLTAAITKAMEEIKKGLQKELQQQGHRLTGALENSLQYEVRTEGNQVIAVMTANDYGVYVEFGVPASRIPYGGNRRGGSGGGKSKYIQGLVRFFELRGVHGLEALSAAFATARKHKREGMPTRSSYAFSENGRRTGFVRATLDRYLPQITDIVEREAGFVVDLVIAETIRLEPYKIAV